jgi:hypothetical protein
VQHHVGVAVAVQPTRVVDAHAAQDQGPALDQPVSVMSNADTHFGDASQMVNPANVVDFNQRP